MKRTCCNTLAWRHQATTIALITAIVAQCCGCFAMSSSILSPFPDSLEGSAPVPRGPHVASGAMLCGPRSNSVIVHNLPRDEIFSHK